MPRQNFLSRESFVSANEIKTRDSIQSLPFHLSHIEMISENKMIDSMRFVYVHSGKNREYFVDVTVLPLNDEFTRVSLHASHTNGRSFYEDPEMAVALHDFESAIHAMLNGDLAAFKTKGSGKEKKAAGVSFFRNLLPGLLLNKKFS